MRVCSSCSPVILKHRRGHSSQLVAFLLRQVRLFVLRKKRQQKHRHVIAAEQVDDASAAAFAASAGRNTKLAYAAGAWNDDATFGIDGNSIDNGGTLLVIQQ